MLRLHSRPIVEPKQVFTPDGILELQAQLSGVYAAETLLDYIVELAEDADGREVGTTGPVSADVLSDVHRYRDRLTARIAHLCDQRAALDAYLRGAPG